MSRRSYAAAAGRILSTLMLLARPDEGIAQDYAGYLRQNRDKLRRYVVQYILSGGGQ